MDDRDQLLAQLSSFDANERSQALDRLLDQDPPDAAETANINMHFHSFHSFNANDWSPTRIAWEACIQGLFAAGLCDFDVVDGLDEFLTASCRLGLRATVNLETRAFLKEYAQCDINSPGEPGVTYIMGAGFFETPRNNTPQAQGLNAYRQGARERNLGLLDRINPHVGEIALDYEKDVLPLTPADVATERHIVRAFVGKSVDVYKTAEAVAEFWAKLLGQQPDEIAAMLNTPAMENLVRNKLAKRGGVGYVQPSEKTFPLVDEFIAWVRSCGALPMTTWLDGTSEGERDGRTMLECMGAKGAVALNIIPDRNWNLKDPDERATKVANLRAMVEAADAMQVPINIGTEMNKSGQPFVDDLAGEVLGEFRASFLRGAAIMVGHTLLARYAGTTYVGEKAAAEFGDVRAKNDLFEAVGKLPPLTCKTADVLREMGTEKAGDCLRDSAAKGTWVL